jgi:IS30 family transposase
VNRAREIERLWAAGESMLAIAAHLGWARGTLSAELDWMRRNGFDVPHRYTMRKRMAA